ISLHNGQTLRGGGFEVRGAETGHVATFGQRPTIESSSLVAPVIELADNITVQGLDLRGGTYGISYIQTLTNSIVADVHSEDALLAGFLFSDIDANSVVTNNVAEGAVWGFMTGTIHGTFTNNLAAENLAYGFSIATIGATGQMDGNVARSNNVGFYID